MRKVSPPLSYPARCFSFSRTRILTPLGFLLGWVKPMGMWWGLDIIIFFPLDLPFIKACGHVGLASCPPSVEEEIYNHSPQLKLNSYFF